uniref:Uncharacterized protein n=1 Tax=Anguilla anguilla TaxID=7936 RepID=A0A0E9PWB0_ANGAN
MGGLPLHCEARTAALIQGDDLRFPTYPEGGSAQTVWRSALP